MEEITKKVALENADALTKEMGYFGWNKTNELVEKDTAYLTFSRDPQMENYQQLRELETKWFSYNYPPLWPMILFSVIAFGLITAMLVMWMTFKEQYDGMFWFLCLGLPAFFFITLSTIWFGYRVNKVKSVLNKMDQERPLIIQQAKTLLGQSENEQEQTSKEN